MLQVREPYVDVPEVYESEVVDVIDHFVEPGDCAIDVGASIGFFSVLLGKRVGPEGLVFAFEPHLDSFKHLAHNVHVVHKLNNVACLKLAAWKFDTADLKLFSIPYLGYSSYHQFSSFYSPEPTEGVALDSTISESNHPRFLKIDCEGTEMEVLLGARAILERGVDCVVTEFNFHIFRQTGRSDRQIREFMAALGYDMFFLGIGDGNEGYRRPVKIDLEKNIEVSGGNPGDHFFNVLFSTEEKVRERWSKIDNISNS